MRLKDLPVHERPRERVLARGVEALADRELLAILLGSGTPGSDAVELAARLIARHGGLHDLSRADPQELTCQPGVGPAKAARICAAFHLGQRARAPGGAVAAVGSTAALAAAAAPLLRGLRGERVVVVVCDGNGAVLRASPLSQGTSTASALSVRELLTQVLRCGGSAFGLAHNHPGGNPEPSLADRQVTHRIQEAAEVLGLRFLDHVIITDETWRRVEPTAGS
ncbi:DNA repair protein [Frankia sp. CcI49]|uniref:JAB domain-containing protein n=1 Tax=unclassified Frankia TaxID=2632575 RepID=UPI0006CA3C4C|nr:MULTISPECIES: DNA repair protein RadC [unclassified Frankia]KPM57811.1 DNA repair protein [Frankia sp. R43]ONH58111.1 DNA repair protein [Frankia sp. CcI49]